MFVKGPNSKPAGKDAKPAVVEKFNGKKSRDGVNILILGTDGRIGEKSDETRTDSIMVVNVNNKEGKIKMVSFMRDTLVHIDGVSQQNIPEYDGYYDQKLNTAFTIGEQNNNQGLNWCVRCSKITLTLTSNITPWSISRPLRQRSIPSSQMGSR